MHRISHLVDIENGAKRQNQIALRRRRETNKFVPFFGNFFGPNVCSDSQQLGEEVIFAVARCLRLTLLNEKGLPTHIGRKPQEYFLFVIWQLL